MKKELEKRKKNFHETDSLNYSCGDFGCICIFMLFRRKARTVYGRTAYSTDNEKAEQENQKKVFERNIFVRIRFV